MTVLDHIAVQVLAHYAGVENVMVVPMTQDRIEHAVTDIEVQRERQTKQGIYRAMCGRYVAPGSLATPPGRPCRACLAVLAEQQPRVRSTRSSRTGHRLRAAARRALGHATTPDEPPVSSDRPNTPAGGRRRPDLAASRSSRRHPVGRLAS